MLNLLTTVSWMVFTILTSQNVSSEAQVKNFFIS